MINVFKFLVGLIAFLLIFSVSSVIMIYGWGIEPKNWLVIIVGNLIISFFGVIPAILK